MSNNKNNWYCYMIVSKSHKNHTYTGITNNLENRLKKHNSGGGAKATRKFKDWEYFRTVKFATKSKASSFEWYWKHYKTRTGKWTRTRSGLDQKLKRLNELLKSRSSKE